MMIRVWEYDVPQGSREEFERVYGADGDWARLFSSSNGYAGTELFGSLSVPGRYITVDRFTDQATWLAFLVEHREAYERLDEQSERLTSDERELAGPVAD
jgi:heme-degrading monooxygenase HmoA